LAFLHVLFIEINPFFFKQAKQESSMVEHSEDKIDENQLVRTAKTDPTAFGELYRRYVERVYKYIYSYCENGLQAEDATAQTFLAAFESIHRCKNEEHFASWLFAIAHNKTMDTFRQRRKSVPFEEIDIPSSEDDPLSQVVQTEQSETLAHMIQALTNDEKELLRLRFLAKLSYADMGQLLHHSEDSVKKSTYRLLARLHDQMEGSND
jgi:RNA polymerase sigma-70 factor (ECF subfamily)